MRLSPGVCCTVLAVVLCLPAAHAADPEPIDWSLVPKDLQVIIALGNGHKREARPHPRMVRRVGRAVQAWTRRPKAMLLVTGGYTSGHVAEAEEMKIIATAMGVPASRILMDTRSGSTHANAENAFRLMQERGWTQAAVVTSKSHLRRAVPIFQEAGLESIHPLPSNGFSMEGAPWPQIPNKIKRLRRKVDVVLLWGHPPSSADPAADLLSAGGHDRDLAFTAAALYRSGFKRKKFYVWVTAYPIGHVTRSEVLGLSAIGFGMPHRRLTYAPARRFAQTETRLENIIAEAGWDHILVIAPAKRVERIQKWLRRKRLRNVQVEIFEAFKAPGAERVTADPPAP